jgi:uncharacterized membrane-anchored protein
MKLPGNRWTLVGLSICVLGLVALIGRAEFVHRTRPHWEFRVTGYDPRDILRGHFLNLRYDLDRSGTDTCGSGEATWPLDERLDWGCCLCLTQTDGDRRNPEVRQMDCDQAEATCDGWIRSGDMQPPIEYFIPEDRALELEAALRDREASIELVVDPEGHPALVELYLDGVPWRDALP